MHISLLRSKIHHATVTDANIHYVGSVTIDKTLLEATGLLVHEKVHIVNVNNGARFETYIIEGKANSGVVCLNGAAARLVAVGDTVIIMAYAHMTLEEAKNHQPKVIVLDKGNKITHV